MDIAAIAISLLLPWMLGVAVLSAFDWPARDGGAGGVALRTGFGYIIGAILLTLWMRALSAAEIGFSRAAIGAPILVAAAGLMFWAARNGRISLADFAAALSALFHPTLKRWQNVVWIAVIAWLAVHFALMAAETAWRPLYPWDAWVQWATKARVWYELGRIVPFVHAHEWLAGAGNAYTDASPYYPATVPLLQVWTCVVLGRWDDSAMNWPWPAMLMALTLALYGAFRGEGIAPLTALFGAYFLATLPLVDAHVALAGYADLPMAAVYGMATIALYRWSVRRDARNAAVAIFLAVACPMIKNPGWIWAMTLVPGAMVVVIPRRGFRVVGVCFVLGILAFLLIARAKPTILGYHVNLDFNPAWRQLIKSYYLMGNWNLLWYAVLALIVFGWRRLREPPLVPLTAVASAGFLFLGIVFSFTNAASWIFDLTTANRASMHLAPLLVFLGVLTWQRLTEPLAAAAPAAAPETP